MTREEAIEEIKQVRFNLNCQLNSTSRFEEAFEMAIKALEQEPCDVPDINVGDMISRQAVLDEISDYNNDLDYTTNELYDRIKRMSPVNPQSKTGQEPCEDAISRQAVLEYIEGSGAELGHSSENELVCQHIKEFPSVNPQPKTEQEPCEDAISLSEAIERFKNTEDAEHCKWTLQGILDELNDLPSVTPQPKTGWIPVSEKLPEDGELVLFSTKTDRVFEGRYFADNTDRQWYAFRDETFAWNNVVIAWMPLSVPYKPQERSGEE